MKKILVPTDFSEYSDYALEAAAQLARKMNAKIILFHMVGTAQSLFLEEELQKRAEASYYLELGKKKFVELLSKDYMKGIEIEEIIQNYKILSEINNVAHEKGVDLIVMGSHGVTGIKNMFVGTNTEKVVRTSDFPVLIIKKRIPDLKLETVVLACDFQPEAIKAYRKAISFFKNYNSNIYTLYVNLPNENYMSTDQMKKRAQEFLYVVDKEKPYKDYEVHFWNDFTKEDGIYTFAKAVKADLIAVLIHGKKGLIHFFSGSLGEDLANYSPLPIITFKIW